jgi:hypothetical protein
VSPGARAAGRSGARPGAPWRRRVLLAAIAGACALPAAAPGQSRRVDLLDAVMRDDPGAVRTMLLRGADANMRDEQGTPALVLAARERAWKAVRALAELRGTELDATNRQGADALMYAALHGELDTVRFLVERKAEVNKTGWTALHFAASNGHADVVRFLLERHAYIDAESPNRTTPADDGGPQRPSHDRAAAGGGGRRSDAAQRRGHRRGAVRHDRGRRGARRVDLRARRCVPPSPRRAGGIGPARTCAAPSPSLRTGARGVRRGRRPRPGERRPRAVRPILGTDRRRARVAPWLHWPDPRQESAVKSSLRLAFAGLMLALAGGALAQPRLIAIANFGEHPALRAAVDGFKAEVVRQGFAEGRTSPSTTST